MEISLIDQSILTAENPSHNNNYIDPFLVYTVPFISDIY